MLVVDTPQRESAVLQPFPTVPQVGEFDALVGFGGFVVVIRRIQPRHAKGVIGCQQPLHIAANCLFGSEALDTLLRAFAIQFIGVRRDIPCLCCHVEK
jgi:hypothetical protein